ncbi:hypothetical protein CDL15_Pgr002042 [Punica granatum]|uniref:Uncharacterized protein n=1 Tax=Punica granatum TaxID=22663 RepID=A0A218XC06_PUNGR|nr:hypothetical protein CDL15_Pgr002042 [Punica granatum]PKI52403.1 hypothetical protein CRG98_027206 [Punica granatum]
MRLSFPLVILVQLLILPSMAEFTFASNLRGMRAVMQIKRGAELPGEGEEITPNKDTSSGSLREVHLNNHHNIPRESYGGWDDSQDGPSGSP